MLKLYKALMLTLTMNMILYTYSQEIRVNTTSIEIIDNKLVIKYDILNSTEKQNFNVLLEISSSSRSIIATKSLTGDIGMNVKGGMSKQIVWDFVADNIIVQDNINIVVTAKIITPQVSAGKAIFLSTVFPGLGMSAIDNGKPYWLLGVAGYGCLGASFYLNKKAKDTYSQYQSNTDESLNDALLSDSQSQYNLSRTLTYAAVGIWGVNLVWTAIKARGSNSKPSMSMVKNQKFLFYAGFDPLTKSSGFNLRYRF